MNGFQVFQYLQCVPSRWRALVQFSDDSTSTARLESETLAHIIQQRTKENCLQREILKEFYSSPVVQCCEEIFGILMTPIVLGFCKNTCFATLVFLSQFLCSILFCFQIYRCYQIVFVPLSNRIHAEHPTLATFVLSRIWSELI